MSAPGACVGGSGGHAVRMFDRVVTDLDVEPLFRLRLVIDGIEISQAIQYFEAAQHLTDPADRGADDAVRSSPTSRPASASMRGACSARCR